VLRPAVLSRRTTNLTGRKTISFPLGRVFADSAGPPEKATGRRVVATAGPQT